MCRIKREFKIFLFILFFLSLSMHFNAWITQPIFHIQSLEKSNMGWSHPLVFTFGVYLLVVFLRSIRKIVKSIGKKLSA